MWRGKGCGGVKGVEGKGCGGRGYGGAVWGCGSRMWDVDFVKVCIFHIKNALLFNF